MPKINVYLPDELAEAVKEAGVPISAICQRALEQAVRRITAIRELALGDLENDSSARLTRFTKRAREAVQLAAREAEEKGAAEVGTEHLLSGLLAEGDNLALRILPTLEIEAGEIARRLAALPKEGAGAAGADAAAGATPETDDGHRFSSQAAAALELAVTEATALGHNYVGCEHLLLGLIAEPEGAAGRVLRALGAEPRLTRRAISAALTGYAHQRVQAAPPTRLEQAIRELTERLERLEQRID